MSRRLRSSSPARTAARSPSSPTTRRSAASSALRRAREMTPDEIIAELNASNLRGRGGAFFPTGRKWSFVPKPDQMPKPHYLVVNADESEPGHVQGSRDHAPRPAPLPRGLPDRGARDRVEARLRLHPRRVRARVRGARRPRSSRCARAKLLGDVTIVIHRGAGAYICGEETALLESLEGKRGQPRTKPPFPAIAGLYASPTAVNNVESITTVPPIIEMGGAEYAKLGAGGLDRARASSRSRATSPTRATTSCRTGSRSRT